MITFWIPESVVPVDDNLFLELCRNNPDNRIERTQKGEIKIMSPTGGETGKWNFKVYYHFQTWNKSRKIGIFFDSSTAFRLSNSAIRSPDLAFLRLDRWNSLSQAEKETFPPICPDFVLEIRSKSDSLKDAQSKMQEWIENGCKLAWLFDLENFVYYTYRPEKELEVKSGKDVVLYGEDVLNGFEFSMAEFLEEE